MSQHCLYDLHGTVNKHLQISLTQETLLRWSLMLAPAMETLGESSRLLVLQCQEQLSWPVWLFRSHVLNVNLKHKYNLHFNKTINSDLNSFQVNFLTSLWLRETTSLTHVLIIIDPVCSLASSNTWRSYWRC